MLDVQHATARCTSCRAGVRTQPQITIYGSVCRHSTINYCKPIFVSCVFRKQDPIMISISNWPFQAENVKMSQYWTCALNFRLLTCICINADNDLEHGSLDTMYWSRAIIAHWCIQSNENLCCRAQMAMWLHMYMFSDEKCCLVFSRSVRFNLNKSIANITAIGYCYYMLKTVCTLSLFV
jgi:hypothetical protein